MTFGGSDKVNSQASNQTVAIIGCGFVGLGWAIVFARAGHPVMLHDPDAAVLNDAHARLSASLQESAAAGLIDEPVADILARFTAVPTLEDAVSQAVYAQESSPEVLELKRDLFARLDAYAPPNAILASSSSGLTCTNVCGQLPGRHRCIVAHPANPPHLLPAVEMVPAAFTDPEVVERASDLLKRANMVPIVVGEIDGFVMNRLQCALVQEALELVEAGIADADAVDAIVRGSLGLRWSFMGPFETMDLNAPGGFGDYARRYGPGFAKLAGAESWPCDAVVRVDSAMRMHTPLDALHEKRAWRDRRLAALSLHCRNAEPSGAKRSG